MNNKDPFLIFSERLKYLRESRDLTQKELSEDLKSYGVNITENMISLFERGITEPKLYYIDAIARYFDSSPNFMLGYTQNSSNGLSFKVDADILFKYINMSDYTPDDCLKLIELISKYLRSTYNR